MRAAVLLLVALLAPQLASGQTAIQFSGRLSFGAQAATAGIPVNVFAVRGSTLDACGSADTSSGGAYTLEVPANDRCVAASGNAPQVQYIFVVKGLRAGTSRDHAASLDRSSSLGKSAHQDLQVPIEAVDPPGRHEGLVAVRFFGIAIEAGVPAPLGRVVNILPQAGGSCGSGKVYRTGGQYYVDIPNDSHCLRSSANAPPVLVTLQLGSLNAGAARIRAVRSDALTWGTAQRQDIAVRVGSRN